MSYSQLAIFYKTEVNLISDVNPKSAQHHYFADVSSYRIFHLLLTMTILYKPEAGLIIEANAIYVKSQGSTMLSALSGKTRPQLTDHIL